MLTNGATTIGGPVGGAGNAIAFNSGIGIRIAQGNGEGAIPLGRAR